MYMNYSPIPTKKEESVLGVTNMFTTRRSRRGGGMAGRRRA
jgi:hypothetical protein